MKRVKDFDAQDCTVDALEVLMNEAWPAPETMERDGWVLRSASSVTQRANSVWPRQAPTDLDVALRDIVRWYAMRRQPVIFQITQRPENSALEQQLDLQGYSRQSETLIMTAGGNVDEAPPTPAGIALTFSDAPSEAWIQMWWRIDGRGGAAEREVARGILTGVPSLYASAVNDDGMVVGTGRVTLVNGWAGIYCMSVHPDFRRRGIAASILRQLLDAARDRGSVQAWLLVTAANAGAQALYERGGFREVGRYHYRQAPRRRAPMAC
ncbi:Acetyltransferase (GNAT) family protein [Arthrobacter alpinus]|uniref:Acetyltransferase (GNAT) family protein n=1 Tax=Arthrobacter alpinus TaxID=656366 RepID=A0A1H5GC83_9MICC|nr:Acetyltransferase (GNAT) family protein [Arthrobacter alpinus]